MDFQLNDDQLALQEGARDLLDGQADPARVRAVVDGGEGFDPELWSAMVEQGWMAMAVPEDRGGIGLGWVELAVLLEQSGRHTAPVPFLQQVLVIDALSRSDATEVIDRIEPLIAGERFGTIAWRPITAAETANGWTVSGRPEPVIHSDRADLCVVRSDTDLFLVELEGLDRKPEPAMDRTRRLGWITFDHTPAVRLGGLDAVDRFVDAGATGHAAELLGGADRSLEMSVAYAKDRHQFGQPIGSFQAVKHRCADMLVDVEGMRSTVYYAAWSVAVDDHDVSVAASTAKSWCSDASRRVLTSALQVHGGIGFTWEHDLHFFLKRGQLDAISFGDATYHRNRLADLLHGKVLAGQSVI